MVSRVRIPKGRRRPPGTKKPTRSNDPRKIDENTRKNLIQYYRGLRQKPGGTKPKPKAVPKGTKTGPAVKGEMSTRPKKPDYLTRPKPKRPTRPRTGPTPRPRPPRPTRKPPTRRPSRRPTGGMDAIRRGMRGRRRGFQR